MYLSEEQYISSVSQMCSTSKPFLVRASQDQYYVDHILGNDVLAAVWMCNFHVFCSEHFVLLAVTAHLVKFVAE